MSAASVVFQLLVFPGFLFAAVLGLMAGWLDRKVSARFQYRVGPPLFQNFNDIFKLMGKETILPRSGLAWLFRTAPVLGWAVLTAVAALIGGPLFFGRGLGGDLVVVVYLLMFYSVAVVLGAASTGNVFSSLGAGREIKLLLADELAFFIVCLVPVIRSGYSLDLDRILAVQAEHGAFLGSVSGALAFVIGLLAVQAKMALPPFHIPEAETEIAEGPFIEYSGPLFAFWKIAQSMMYAVFPCFLILLFWGGFRLQGLGWLAAAGKYLLIVVLMIIIKNTNPRLRTDTALAFFWKIAAPLAVAAVVLAVLGV
jgi:NADH-quinone oxidoreductase subunit H